jgi:hypothetical protein
MMKAVECDRWRLGFSAPVFIGAPTFCGRLNMRASMILIL